MCSRIFNAHGPKGILGDFSPAMKLAGHVMKLGRGFSTVFADGADDSNIPAYLIFSSTMRGSERASERASGSCRLVTGLYIGGPGK